MIFTNIFVTIKNVFVHLAISSNGGTNNGLDSTGKSLTEIAWISAILEYWLVFSKFFMLRSPQLFTDNSVPKYSHVVKLVFLQNFQVVQACKYEHNKNCTADTKRPHVFV